MGHVTNWVYNPNSLRLWLKSSPPTSMFCLSDLEPLKHNNVAFRTRKEILTLIYLMMSSYFSPLFLLIFSANAWWNFEHSWPIAPDVVKMSGVNVPCSISITRWLYSLFLLSSWVRRILCTVELTWLSDSALVIRTSKNAFWPARQNPLVRMSRRASSRRLAVSRSLWRLASCAPFSTCCLYLSPLSKLVFHCCCCCRDWDQSYSRSLWLLYIRTQRVPRCLLDLLVVSRGAVGLAVSNGGKFWQVLDSCSFFSFLFSSASLTSTETVREGATDISEPKRRELGHLNISDYMKFDIFYLYNKITACNTNI